MHNPELVNTLITNLAELNQHLSELYQLLLSEETALVEKQQDDIEILAAKKIALTRLIEQTDKARLAVCEQLGIKPDRQSIQIFTKRLDKDSRMTIAKHWQKITTLGQHCSSQNQINGILVAHHQRYTRQALEILRGSMTNHDIYSEKGATATGTDSKILGRV